MNTTLCVSLLRMSWQVGICIKLQTNYQESDLNIQARGIDVLGTFEILELEL